MIKNILLDLDDTILDFHAAEAAALKKTLCSLGITPTPARLCRYSAINKEHWERLERGELTRPQVMLGRFRVFFEQEGLSGWECAAARYESFLSVGHFFCAGAEELLGVLAPRYRLYLASNGVERIQRGRIASAGIAPYFQGMFVSEQVGAHKPSPAFFEAIFRTIADFRKEETVIVGDSLTSDMRGGIDVGIHTVWYNPQGKENVLHLPIDRTYRSHDQLPSLLQELGNM